MYKTSLVPELRESFRQVRDSGDPERLYLEADRWAAFIAQLVSQQDAEPVEGETIEALKQGFNAMVQKGWDHDAKIVARHIASLRARVQPRRVGEETRCWALAVSQEDPEVANRIARKVIELQGRPITPEEENDDG